MDNRSRVRILGVDIHKVTTQQVLAEVTRWMKIGGGPRMICTPNEDLIMKARRDFEFREILNNADLSIPDGMAVVRASRILGEALQGTVNGRVLAEKICELASGEGWSVFFLGGNPDAARRAGERMRERYPGLKVAGHCCPRYGFTPGDPEDDRAVKAVLDAAPDVLFVALGAPKQEKWLAANLQRLNVPVSMGVGYAFDILGGLIEEPPKWTTSFGVEWIYRLSIEPRRLWRRYLLEGAVFVSLVLRAAWRLRSSS